MVYRPTNSISYSAVPSKVRSMVRRIGFVKPPENVEKVGNDYGILVNRRDRKSLGPKAIRLLKIFPEFLSIDTVLFTSNISCLMLWFRVKE